MSKETRADERKRLLPVIIACVLLIGVAAWVSVLLPDESDEKSVPSELIARQLLREWNGQIALCEEGTDEPL